MSVARGRARRNALTLLELMIVTTILGLLVTVTTLNMPLLSDEARARSAGAQMQALFRLAQFSATRTGRPSLFECRPEGCMVRRPVRKDGGWSWARGPSVTLSRGLRLLGITSDDEAEPIPGRDMIWRVPVASRDVQGPYLCLIRTSRGLLLRQTLTGRSDTTIYRARTDPNNAH